MPRAPSNKRLLVGLGLAVAAHSAALAAYEIFRPLPPARLLISVDGEGTGKVFSIPDGISCGDDCGQDYEPGTTVKLVAVLGKGATLKGWDGCEINPDYAKECTIVLSERTTKKVTLTFGKVPERVRVALVRDPAEPDVDSEDKPDDTVVTLPSVDEIPEPLPLDQVAPPSPPPQLVQKPPPLEKVDPAKLEKPKYNMKSVEVPDKNTVAEAPADARFLSDKNRDVTEETRAEDTNLEREQAGEQAPSEESTNTDDNVGGEDERIADLEDSEATSLDDPNADDTTQAGDSDKAVGVLTGESGTSGDSGQKGVNDDSAPPGVLAMRGIQGRGELGGPAESPNPRKNAEPSKGRPGVSGAPGVREELSWDDYERIVGKDAIAEEVKLGAKQLSQRKGRFERRLAATRSALENFSHEVKPGNTTALKTRAAPFAVFISRMHRRIHRLWGFGFLTELDDMPAGHELNVWSRWVKLEIIILPDGVLDKVNIVRTSGSSMFDIAAVDALYTAAPFEPPPKEIRSPDGKVYMHWKFHRDWRQCGTFLAEPFILTSPRGGSLRDKGFSGGLPGGHSHSHKHGGQSKKPLPPPAPSRGAAAATARALSNMPTPNDPRAQHTANLWLTGFAKGDLKKMLRVSKVPFRSGGEVVAHNNTQLSRIYRTVMKESGRGVRDHAILTPAGYRRRFGTLPKGTELSPSDLLFAVRTRGDQFTLVLHFAGGDFKVTGLYR